MLDLTISKAKLNEATRQLTRARKSEHDELVDITCTHDSVKFVVTGREFSCLADVTSLGSAEIPLDLLPRLRKVAATFDTDVRIRIEPGRVRVNSMSISHPAVALKRIGGRMIDIPDDAPAQDVLALQFLFTNTEIAESNLLGRVLEATSKLQKALDSATALEQFGVTRHQLRALVRENLKLHAESIRPNLLG
ncbi:MAG TPA: hypothetical protein VN612_07065 [Acidobacteriaceae bacterium]|nr:hypothetical protein [Acidobacteriaceae bacterium]